MKKLFLVLVLVYLASNLAYAQSKKTDSLLAVTKSTKHDTLRAMAFGELAKIYGKEGDSIAYKKIITEAEQLFKTAKHPKVGNLYFLIKALYEEKFTGNREAMIELFTKSYDYCLKANDKLTASKRMNKIAHNLVELGKYKEAIEKYYLNVKLCEEAGNDIGLSYAYFGLGEIFRVQRNLPKALEVYRNAYSISLKTNDPAGLSASYNNLGMIHNSMDNNDSAMFYYQKGLEFNEKRGNELEMANTLDRIATLYLDKQQNDKGLEMLKRSLALKLKFDDKEELATTYINITEAYYNMGKDVDAMKSIEEALKYAKQAQLIEHIEYCYKLMGLIYQATGRYQQSAESFYKYINLHDSLITLQSNRLVTEMEEKYQTEKKQKEIEILNKDKVIQEGDLKKQKQFIYFIMLALVLLLAVVFVVIRGLRQKKRDNLILAEKNEIIHEQKTIVEEKNKEITDSINYAKRIQYALLAHNEFLKQNLPDHFVLFKPKDIVSGDYYWAAKVMADDENNLKQLGIKERFYLAVCDSTGHGVPGAFMSLLNIGFLSEAIKEKNIFEPNKVFDYVRERLINAISREGQKDGFDGVLVCIDHLISGGVKITYAAANNSPILIRGDKRIELEVDKMPVGYGERKENFRLFTIDHQEGDMLYVYTDGYADQFGGPRGKKFMYKQLNQMLSEMSSSVVDVQKDTLLSTFMEWKGQLEQIDDVCVIGIRL